MWVICGDFNMNHHIVSSKLKTLQNALLYFDQHYVEIANRTKETKTSNSCNDFVYSNVNIDLKVSPITLTDLYTLFMDYRNSK